MRAARLPRAAGTYLRKGLSECDLLGRLSKTWGCGTGLLSLQSQDENCWPLVTGRPQGSEAGFPGCRSLLGVCGRKQSQDRSLQCPRSGSLWKGSHQCVHRAQCLLLQHHAQGRLQPVAQSSLEQPCSLLRYPGPGFLVTCSRDKGQDQKGQPGQSWMAEHPMYVDAECFHVDWFLKIKMYLEIIF